MPRSSEHSNSLPCRFLSRACDGRGCMAVYAVRMPARTCARYSPHHLCRQRHRRFVLRVFPGWHGTLPAAMRGSPTSIPRKTMPPVTPNSSSATLCKPARVPSLPYASTKYKLLGSGIHTTTLCILTREGNLSLCSAQRIDSLTYLACSFCREKLGEDSKKAVVIGSKVSYFKLKVVSDVK